MIRPRTPIKVVEGVRVKRCSTCKVDKSLADYNQGIGPAGLDLHCRACRKAYRELRKQLSSRALSHEDGAVHSRSDAEVGGTPTARSNTSARQ